MRDALYIAGLFDFGRAGEIEHDPLDRPGSKRHPDQVPRFNVQLAGDAVCERPFLAARAVNGDPCEVASGVVHRGLWARFHQARVRELDATVGQSVSVTSTPLQIQAVKNSRPTGPACVTPVTGAPSQIATRQGQRRSLIRALRPVRPRR